MRLLPFVAALLLAAPAAAGANDPWTVDRSKSRIEFNATQVGKIVTGRIGDWTASIVLDPANLAASRIDVRMNMKSATAGTKDIDDLMLGKDFLDVQRMPEARFVSESVSAASGDKYEARGKLTIRDVTRDVVLPFTLRIGEQATARGRLGIKRLDYGVGRNEWAATNYVADEITIEFTVVASRPAPR
jgi:polyisoprenoid-binding protein YceI